jgi:hypothetical protein
VQLRVPSVAELNVMFAFRPVVNGLPVVSPAEFSVLPTRSYFFPVYSMSFCVVPVDAKETVRVLLDLPHSGLVIVPITLPIASVLKALPQIAVVGTGVKRIPGLLVLVVMIWKVAVVLTVPFERPAEWHSIVRPRRWPLSSVKSSSILPVVELPLSKLPVMWVSTVLNSGSLAAFVDAEPPVPVKLVTPVRWASVADAVAGSAHSAVTARACSIILLFMVVPFSFFRHGL